MAAPNSFRDSFWSDLASTTERKLDIPAGLLVSVLTNGERSNGDQVSEAGAKTVFQVTPTTRDLVLKRDGIDAYLSPENAAEVAGLVLKDGLNWANKQTKDPDELNRLAAGFYHAGGDPKNWGPRTNAYVGRVADGLKTTRESALQNDFAKWMQANPARPAPADPVANGQPAPTDALAAGFGQFLQGQQAKQQALTAPRGVDAIPGPGAGDVAPPATQPAGPEYSALGSMNIPGTGVRVGDAEALLSLGTGAVGGTLGMVGGLVGGTAGAVMNGDFGSPQAASRIEQGMDESAQALTYAPRTPEGQQRTAQIGGVLAETIPMMPLTAELQGIGRGAASAAPAVGATARAGAESVSASAKAVSAETAQAMSTVTGKIRAALGKSGDAQTAGGSVGAAGADVATMRRTRADQLPVPIKLTEGQATRSFEQTRFERETAKEPMAGLLLRERFAEQNDRALKNFDAFVDLTGAESPSLRATGAAVDQALVKQFQADKTKVRAAYKKAEKAGEMESPVTLQGVVDHLNESAPDAATAPILDVARKRAVRLGLAIEDADGNLVAQPVPLRTAETMRQAISRATDYEPTNVRQATIIKGLIDETTDGMGGGLYRAARAERRRMAQNYEDRAVINKLVTTKRGSTDRNVALEDVFAHSILDGSLDDVRNVRRVLQRSGNEGQQAWRELQGQTVNYLKTEATKNVARDVRGNEIISPAALDRAVKRLDADGKLDFVFGKRGASQIRDLNDIAKDLYTVPPGSVNTSNTASVLLAALDMGVSGAAGIPLPVMSGLRMLMNEVKDRQLAARVKGSLGPVAPPAPPPRLPSETAF